MKEIQWIGIGDSWGQYVGDKFGIGERGMFSHLAELLGVPGLNLAVAGDASEVMMGLSHRARLESALPGKNFMVVSAGGDDIAGDGLIRILNEAKDVGGDVSQAVDQYRLSAKLDDIDASYEDLACLRDDLAPDCVILSHEYDFPPAEMMGKGLLILGPWLQPSLSKCGWTRPEDQALIVREQILMPFAERRRAFAAKTRNVCHARTQGVCSPQHWANEMHLTGDGFLLEAQVLNAAMLPWIDKISMSSPAT